MGYLRDGELLESIALRLKAMREAKGASQLKVMLDTEINMSRIESGKSNLSVSTLSRLCAYFGVTMAEFFTELEHAKGRARHE